MTTDKKLEQSKTCLEEEDDDEDAILDLTSSQLHDLAEVDLAITLKELDLTANRLTVLDERIGKLSQLRKLSLRQNLFTNEALNPLSHWPAIAGLQEIVLRDNKLTRIPPVGAFASLQVLDISFNELSSLEGLSEASNTLQELYVSKNEVTKMEELNQLCELRLLELGSNKIRVMEGLQNLNKLQELWLGRNRIRIIDLCGLSCLVKISVQSNRLTSMLGFQNCICLEELYLSHNGISKMEGLSTLANLRVLDISNNRISSINDIASLMRLEDLWLNDNQITSLDGIELAISGSRKFLTTIYLERNPCASDPNYFSKLRSAFSKLQQIDSLVL